MDSEDLDLRLSLLPHIQFGMYTGIGTHEHVHTSYINREEKETETGRERF